MTNEGSAPPSLPRHVAIIMDGNGRWANLRGLPRVEGHRMGVRSVRVIVESGARTGADATKAARAVASSPLVKTAVYGADLNWGRVIAVLGRAGIAVDPMKVSMRFAGETVLRRGMRADPAAERRATPKIRAEAYAIDVDLGLGKGCDYVYFSDLSVEYVKLNSGYRS